jgi:hypothetical protein
MTQNRRMFRAGMLAVLVLLLALLGGCDSITKKSPRFRGTLDFDDIPYEVNTQPLEERFPDVGHIDRAYWKSKAYDDGWTPGPSTYRTSGFLFVDDLGIDGGELFREISYPDFPDGIDPFITGLTGFDWRAYPSVKERMLGSRFVGTVYVDVQKNLIFFDVENT